MRESGGPPGMSAEGRRVGNDCCWNGIALKGKIMKKGGGHSVTEPFLSVKL